MWGEMREMQGTEEAKRRSRARSFLGYIQGGKGDRTWQLLNVVEHILLIQYVGPHITEGEFGNKYMKE